MFPTMSHKRCTVTINPYYIHLTLTITTHLPPYQCKKCNVYIMNESSIIV